MTAKKNRREAIELVLSWTVSLPEVLREASVRSKLYITGRGGRKARESLWKDWGERIRQRAEPPDIPPHLVEFLPPGTTQAMKEIRTGFSRLFRETVAGKNRKGNLEAVTARTNKLGQRIEDLRSNLISVHPVTTRGESTKPGLLSRLWAYDVVKVGTLAGTFFALLPLFVAYPAYKKERVLSDCHVPDMDAACEAKCPQAADYCSGRVTVTPNPTPRGMDTPTPTPAPTVSSLEQRTIDLIQSFANDGYIESTEGSFYAIADFSQTLTNPETYTWEPTGYSPKDFVITAHTVWDVTGDTVDPAYVGCGLGFREVPEDHTFYQLHIDLGGTAYLWQYMGGETWRDLAQAPYGKLSANRGEADIALLVEGPRLHFFVNGEHIFSQNDLQETPGQLSFVLYPSGTSPRTDKGFGTKCKMDHVALWVIE